MMILLLILIFQKVFYPILKFAFISNHFLVNSLIKNSFKNLIKIVQFKSKIINELLSSVLRICNTIHIESIKFNFLISWVG